MAAPASRLAGGRHQDRLLVALRWLGVDMRRIWLPLAVSNAVFAVLYYAVVLFGLGQIANP